MRTMSACCLRVSLKLSEEVMSDRDDSYCEACDDAWKETTKGQLWETCGIRGQRVGLRGKGRYALKAPGQGASGSKLRRIAITTSRIRAVDSTRGSRFMSACFGSVCTKCPLIKEGPGKPLSPDGSAITVAPSGPLLLKGTTITLSLRWLRFGIQRNDEYPVANRWIAEVRCPHFPSAR